MANSISPIILQLMAEGPQGIEAKNALTSAQAQEAGAQAGLATQQTQNAQLQNQIQQTGYAAEQKGLAQKYGAAGQTTAQAAAAPGTPGSAPAAGQTPLTAAKNLFQRLLKPKTSTTSPLPSGGGTPSAPDEEEE